MGEGGDAAGDFPRIFAGGREKAVRPSHLIFITSRQEAAVEEDRGGGGLKDSVAVVVE